MDYIEIAVSLATADFESAADLLRDLTGSDVWIETPFAQADLESDAVVSTNGTSIARAYVARGALGTVPAVSNALAAAGLVADVSLRTVGEEDWAESWKEFFQVERFGRRIVVVPTWRDFSPAPDDVVLMLDPGMAFGTGQHETTRMCLEALENVVRPGMRVLDVGCGSGILSLAAAKLGASRVVAVDIDPNCVRITDENARRNAVTGVVEAHVRNPADAWPARIEQSGFDVVVANIIARVIIEIADQLVAALATDARLVVSGIIAEREADVVAALSSRGLHVASIRTMGEWRSIEAVKA
jgi:ribosomal protein L11 methyltransferase